MHLQSQFFAILRPFKGYQTDFWDMLDGQECPTGTKKLPKLNIGTIQVKILSQIGPKIDENGEKCRK